jgi:hypothetical protein
MNNGGYGNANGNDGNGQAGGYYQYPNGTRVYAPAPG